MIQYPISEKELKERIEKEKIGWLNKAAKRTAKLKAAGKYNESSSIWSEIKVVYMRLQHGKCAYCERSLEHEKYGKIEHDLEHFRPKKKAKPWKLSNDLKSEGIIQTQPAQGKSDPGYHLLAYHHLNYCTSCKTCNSRLKSDYFPITGPRSSLGNDPVKMQNEKPLLVNPVGDFDTDPAELISFYGVNPQAIGDTNYKRHRGLVSIVFFKLDDHNRKNLFRERANIIVSLYSFLEIEKNTNDQETKKNYRNLIEVFCKESSPHTNCACSFYRLYNKNYNKAKELFLLATKYLVSISN